MRNLLLLVGSILAAAGPAFADTTVTGDAQVTGQVGVNTIAPGASFEVKMGSADAYALKVSSPNGDPLLVIDNKSRMGVGLASPGAGLDIHGSADNGDIGLQLRVGNSSTSTDSSQIVFAYDSTSTFRHSIRTRSNPDQKQGNSLDFYLWNSTGQPNQLGNLHVLSLQAMNATEYASVHVMPSTDAVQEELVVSNGASLGQGTIHCSSAIVPSARMLKSDISGIDEAEEGKAYGEVKSLRHAKFRYKTARKGEEPLMEGLIYEDAPTSIQGPGKSLVFDERLINLEMALKEANRRAKKLEVLILDLERK